MKKKTALLDLKGRFHSARKYAETEFFSLARLVRGQASAAYEALQKNPNRDGAVLALHRAPLVVVGVVVLILLLMLATCGRQEPLVTVEPPQKRNIGDTVIVTEDQLHQLEIAQVKQYAFRMQKQAIGQIAFNEDASTIVVTPFSGRVTRVLARIGDNVKRGDPLFEVDSPEVVQAQVDLIAALHALDKTRAQLNLTKQAFDRQTGLLSDRATSQRELDQARNDFAAAQSDFKTAEGVLNAARNRLRVIIGRGNAEIERLERERQIDPLITINAPIDGTVVTRKIGTGQYVRSDAGETLFSISDLSVMWLRASVPEGDIPLMRVGHELEVRVAAVPDRLFKGKIIAIGAASDSSTHRVTVRSEIENPDGVLKSEMFASFKIWIGDGAPGIGVPVEAAIWEGETVYVWVETGAMKLTRRKIKAGIERDRVLQVLEGLQPDDKVVVRGAIFIDNQWKQ